MKYINYDNKNFLIISKLTLNINNVCADLIFFPQIIILYSSIAIIYIFLLYQIQKITDLNFKFTQLKIVIR